MFASDENIETISQLVDAVKHYLTVKTEVVKLDVVEKTVKLLTIATVTIVAFLIFMFIVILLSIAAAFALGNLVGTATAFCIMAGVYFLFLIFFICKRKSWLERPLVRFFASLLLDKE